jgi:TfoX/Sxy family transcriptional regulator of competence genes
VAYDEQLADRLRGLVAAEPGVSEQRMFGGLAFLVDGHMAVAASGGGGLLVRVDPARTAELAALPGAQPVVMRGREMDGWLRVEADGGSPEELLAGWAGRGIAYARSLPPKGTRRR